MMIIIIMMMMMPSRAFLPLLRSCTSSIIDCLKLDAEKPCFGIRCSIPGHDASTFAAEIKEVNLETTRKPVARPGPVKFQKLLLKSFRLDALQAKHKYLIYKCDSCLLLALTCLTPYVKSQWAHMVFFFKISFGKTHSLCPLTKNSEAARALAATIGMELRHRGHFVFDDSDDDADFAANFSK